MKVLYHSCGAIVPLIDDLIEIGVQILNPIQPIPKLMDPAVLSRRFGKRLLFHGGLDVQSLLIEGEPGGRARAGGAHLCLPGARPLHHGSSQHHPAGNPAPKRRGGV